MVQLHPQLHHLDALDEIPAKGKGKGRGKDGEEERAGPAGESEARAIDVKIKAAGEDGEAATVAGNLDLLKQMQDEKWRDYEWVDAEVSFFFFFASQEEEEEDSVGKGRDRTRQDSMLMFFLVENRPRNRGNYTRTT